MAIDIAALTSAITSHAAVTGCFDVVVGAEPKSAPGNGITCAVWADDMAPAKSGLAATSWRITFNVRLYQNMLAEPTDAIDPAMIAAADALLADYIGNFQLGGLVRNVDVRGIDSQGLRVQAGYITQDGRSFRVMTISLPIVVNDLYVEAP